jgi:hypothetical protein
VLIPASPELRAYVARLGDRAEQVRAGAVSPEEDNMLLISTDGRKAALDMRLVGEHPAPGSSKLDIAADTIASVWREHRERTYRDPGGEHSPNPGALQIVFCDLSTPTRPGWNAYRELRDQLAARGIPAEQIRWIHEARNDAEKARLFAACRTGQVAVIVGSTPRMGVGTNIQDRAIALHHLDCPWRPADIEHFVARESVSSVPHRRVDPGAGIQQAAGCGGGVNERDGEVRRWAFAGGARRSGGRGLRGCGRDRRRL